MLKLLVLTPLGLVVYLLVTASTMLNDVSTALSTAL